MQHFNKNKIVKILIQKGRKLLKQPFKSIEFTKNLEADKLLNNLKKYPHAFVLACVMDRQIKAERAWLIPYEISRIIGGFEFSRLFSLRKEKIKSIFQTERLHRFNDVMARNFHLAIQKIHNDYNNNAANIWRDKPRSATVVRKFLELEGVGIKIATMAANALAREFKIPMQDYIC